MTEDKEQKEQQEKDAGRGRGGAAAILFAMFVYAVMAGVEVSPEQIFSPWLARLALVLSGLFYAGLYLLIVRLLAPPSFVRILMVIGGILLMLVTAFYAHQALAPLLTEA